MQDYLIIGQIVKPQGVKGQLKVKVLSDDANRFDDIKTVFIKKDENFEVLSVKEADTRGEYAYIMLNGIDDMDAAEKLKNEFLYVDRENALKLEEGKYFICDLIGASISNDIGEELGVLEDILQTGSADIYCVKGKKNLMFPALKKLITIIDVNNKKIIVNSEVLSEVAVYED